MDYNVFNAALKVSALLLTIIPLIYVLFQTHWKRLQHIAFLSVVISALGEAVFGTMIEFLCISTAKADGNTMLFLFQHLFSVFHISFQVAYSFYVVVASGYLSKTNRIRILIFWAPAVVMNIAFLTNPLNHLFFDFPWIEELGRYELNINRGYHVLWLIAAFYSIASIIIYARNIRGIKYKKTTAIFVISVILTICVLSDKFLPNLRIGILGEAIAVVCALVWIEDEGMLIHPGTGLFNRNAFIEDNATLIGAKNKYKLFCVTLLNHDYITRAYGESNRVKVVDKAAEIFRKTVKRSMPYYLSYGLYAFYYFEKDDMKEKRFIEQLKEELSKPFEIGPGLIIETNWQIVIARIPDDVDTVEAIEDLFGGEPTGKGVIVKRAETEMKGIKRKNDVLLTFERAIKNNNFEVYYQPIYDVASKTIISGEALLRLNDPLLGRISPAEFIPIAEQSGHIKTLGEFVFRETVRFYKENKLEELGVHCLAVNVSIKQLFTQGLADYFIKTVKEFGIPPCRIILEVTESQEGALTETNNSQFQVLREAGFKFSLDDYGTGYSNLTRILNYDFLVVKMDISLLRNATDKKGKTLLKGSIKGMNMHGFDVTQEGVETKEQFKEVVAYGAKYIQGYFVSPPIPAEEYLRFVRDFKGIKGLD